MGGLMLTREFQIIKDTYLSVINKAQSISKDVWNHYAISLQGNTGTIYFNGNILVQGNLDVPNPVIRSSCYIGRSNSIDDTNPQSINASLSDIRIYSRALSQTEIQNIMSSELPMV